MTSKLADEPIDLSNKEIQIRIAERDGQHFLLIKEEQAADRIAEYEVEITASLLPELKRAVEAMEYKNGNEELSANEPIQAQAESRFAHASEEEFARILDFYHIAWQYEPRTFVLERDEAGNPVKSFTPDFYLPEHDLYIEITTLKQSLVTKKNRKVRLLRENYPDVNIKLLYSSDYNKLLEKFAASKHRKEE